MNLIFILSILITITGSLIFISINPIYSVLSLIAVFIFTGSLFIYFDICFIGLSYFIIYVGAISILFIFAIMMLETDQFINPSLKEKLGLKKEIPLITGIIGLFIILIGLWNLNIITTYNMEIIYINIINNLNNLGLSIFDYLNNPIIYNTNISNINEIIKSSILINEIYKTDLSLWENQLITISQINLIGYSLYTYYSLWLILISFILLLAMIGPIILCLKKIDY